MYATDCNVGLIVNYCGSLYQICGRPGKYQAGYVPAVNEQGFIELISYNRVQPFWRFKDLIEEIESGERENCLEWFMIPNKWKEINRW